MLLFIAITSICCKPIAQSPEVEREQKIDQLMNATVTIKREVTLEDGQIKYNLLCSGVWISQKIFLTARHCMEALVFDENEYLLIKMFGIPLNEDQFVGTPIYFSNYLEKDVDFTPTNKPHLGKIIAYDRLIDIAAISTDEETLHTSVPIQSYDTYVSEKLTIIGHTNGIKYNYLEGYVTNLSLTTREGIEGPLPPYLVINSDIGPGNSGGGAFNANGDLVAICSAYSVENKSISLFVPLEQIKYFVDKKGLLLIS